jgi:hypothetical protein
MKIDENYKARIVNEIKLVVKKMREEQDLRRKTYYFSAVHAEIVRVFNLSYDPELVFIHNVLQDTYQNLRARTDALILGRDVVIPVPEALFLELCNTLEELADKITKNEDLYNTLQKISVLGYTVTGNGYYLYEKGILKI